MTSTISVIVKKRSIKVDLSTKEGQEKFEQFKSESVEYVVTDPEAQPKKRKQ